jgi:cobalt-zinc-cadmium efflux system outer membrane protein
VGNLMRLRELGWIFVVLICLGATAQAKAQRATLLSPISQPPLTSENKNEVISQQKPAPADPRPSGTDNYSLTDLENLALANNPTIAAAQALVDQERGLYVQVGLYPNPSFGYLRNDPNKAGQSETSGGFFSQELVVPGKRQLNRAIESQDIRFREFQLEAQKERVRNDVRIRFYEILGAQRGVESAQELEKLAARGVEMAKKQQKAKGSRFDVVRAEIQLQAARVSLEDAHLRHRAAWKQLTYVLGLADLPLRNLAGNLEADIPALDWEDSLQKLLQANPVLRAQEAKIQEARFAWQRARMEAIPNLTVQVVAEHDQVLKFDTVSTFLALPIPVFNRNQGNVATAAANIQYQQKELERQHLALLDQFAVSFRQYETALSHARRLKKDILPRVKENLDLTTKAYEAGQFSIFRLIEAEQLYFETNHAYIDALTEVHKSGIEIAGMLLVGGLNPTEVGTALQAQPGMGGATQRSLLQQLQEQGGGRNRLLPGAVQGAER